MLQHAKLIDFIQRNYAGDAQGRWFFQNGPQRVYVELEATPWIWRVSPDTDVAAHDGQASTFTACWVDEHGWVYLETPLGFGLVHTLDVQNAASAIEARRWQVQEVERAALAKRFGYVQSPQSHKGA